MSCFVILCFRVPLCTFLLFAFSFAEGFRAFGGFAYQLSFVYQIPCFWKLCMLFFILFIRFRAFENFMLFFILFIRFRAFENFACCFSFFLSDSVLSKSLHVVFHFLSDSVLLKISHTFFNCFLRFTDSGDPGCFAGYPRKLLGNPPQKFSLKRIGTRRS